MFLTVANALSIRSRLTCRDNNAIGSSSMQSPIDFLMESQDLRTFHVGTLMEELSQGVKQGSLNT